MGTQTKLDGIKVFEWMTEEVLAVEINDTISVARQLIAKHRINQLPVLENDRLVGIVTDRDIRDAYPTSLMIGHTKEIDEFAESHTVEEVMTHDVFTVEPETPLASAVALLRHHRIGSLPVLKSEQLVGIITRSDVLDFVLGRRRNGSPDGAKKGAQKDRRAAKAVTVKRLFRALKRRILACPLSTLSIASMCRSSITPSISPRKPFNRATTSANLRPRSRSTRKTKKSM